MLILNSTLVVLRKASLFLEKQNGASRNIPAVKVLYLVGVDNAIKTARAMGIEGLSDANQYGLSLALGGGEVSLLNMTSAYGVFANNGVRNPPTGILSVTTADGQVLESFNPQNTLAQQVIPEQTALMMNDVLSDIYARNSIFTLSYTGDRQVAIKTGTTNSSRDAWTIGYTPSISIGAWMGNNDNTPMAQIASALIVSPMWKQFLDYALTKVPVEQFEKPTYDTSNKKPFIAGAWHTDSGEVHSELYWINRNDPMGPPPSNPNSDPEFRLWESAVQDWAGNAGKSLIPVPTSTPETLNTGFRVSVGSSTYIPKGVQATASVSNYPAGTVKVDYYVNGELLGSSNQPPFSIFFIPGVVKSIQDENDLKATAFDALGGHSEATSFFTTN
jgi:membrane peptidoglycan carboxypeptidase